MSNTESWLPVDHDSDFSIHNIPFGIIKTMDGKIRAASAIGDYAIDLNALDELGYFSDLNLPTGIFNCDVLNQFISLGRTKTGFVRKRIIELFSVDNSEFRANSVHQELCLIPLSQLTCLLPIHVPNYTDFYSSIEHATNVGAMFRDPNNALLPNWKHLPVGYHGRASSIVISGTPIIRPLGQTKTADTEKPVFGPTKRLDFELEMAFITCAKTELGDILSTKVAEEYIFGFVIFNDWSARDVQVWEYVPLGPFLAKNFASTVSPWIVTLDALETFRVNGPIQNPSVLPYLQYSGKKNFDIELQVSLTPSHNEEQVISNSNFKYMYWNINQQLAHHTINGCNIDVGDMYASGTISGPTPDSYGSMLELGWKGTKPIKLLDGVERTFINDGDIVTMRGHASKNGIRVGFGEVSSKILPATSY